MENVLDLATWAWRKLGGKKPIRQELRELVQGLEMDPMLLSRGVMHNVAGYDLSRSVGLGRVIPGTETAAYGGETDLEKGIGSLAIDLLGVAGSILRWGYSMADLGPGEGMLRAPGGVGNIYTAYYWSEHGVRGPNDAEITREKDENGNWVVRDLTTPEILGKFFGANPSIVSENREREFGKYEVKMYWQSKRSGLLEKWDEANWKQDEVLRKDAKEAISEFNKEMGQDKEFRSLRISGEDLSQRERARRKRQRLTERGRTQDKRSRQAQGILQRVFEPPQREP